MKEYRIETSATLKDKSADADTINEANICILDSGIEHDLEKIKLWVKEHLEDDFVIENGIRIYDAHSDEIVFRF